MKLPKILLRVALLLAFAVPTFAEVPRGDRLLQSELKQQQIQRTTQRVGDQLAIIINEFERNGIAGEDVKVLRAIRTVLHRLSDKEMAQVVTLLQQARAPCVIVHFWHVYARCSIVRATSCGPSRTVAG